MSDRKSKKDYIAAYELSDAWDEVLLGDRDIFKEMTEPFIPALLEAARKDIKRQRMDGNLLPDILQPEELVGETLIQAWIRRYSYSSRASLKEWLLAIQRWALRLVISEEKDWTKRKALSLEEPAKPRFFDNDHDEWDWITPQSMARQCWRDIIVDEKSTRYAV